MANQTYRGRGGEYVAESEYFLDPILKNKSRRKGYIVKNPEGEIIGRICYDSNHGDMIGYHIELGMVRRIAAISAHNNHNIRDCLCQIAYLHGAGEDAQNNFTRQLKRRRF